MFDRNAVRLAIVAGALMLATACTALSAQRQASEASPAEHSSVPIATASPAKEPAKGSGTRVQRLELPRGVPAAYQAFIRNGDVWLLTDPARTRAFAA